MAQNVVAAGWPWHGVTMAAHLCQVFKVVFLHVHADIHDTVFRNDEADKYSAPTQEADDHVSRPGASKVIVVVTHVMPDLTTLVARARLVLIGMFQQLGAGHDLYIRELTGIGSLSIGLGLVVQEGNASSQRDQF